MQKTMTFGGEKQKVLADQKNTSDFNPKQLIEK